MSQPQAEAAVSEALGQIDKYHAEAHVAATQDAFEAYTRSYGQHLLRMRFFPEIRTAGELLAHVTAAGQKLYETGKILQPFELDGFNLHVYQQLASYFSGDYDTFRCRFDPRKSLLLFGGYGVGKTIAMTLFASNPLRSYKLKAIEDIADEFRLTGDISSYYANFPNQHLTQQAFGQATLGLCIDDIGAEHENVKRYGSTFDLEYLIRQRYRTNNTFNNSHATTNATKEELRQAYGPRTFSRFAELFNILEFPADAPDRRLAL